MANPFSAIGDFFFNQGGPAAPNPAYNPNAMTGPGYGNPSVPQNIYGGNTNYGGLSQTDNVAPGTNSNPQNVGLTSQGVTNLANNQPLPSSTPAPTNGGTINTSTSNIVPASLPTGQVGGSIYHSTNQLPSSGFDSQGNAVGLNNQTPTETTPAQSLNTQIPDTTTPSTSLNNTTGNGDINSALNQNETNSQNLFGSINGYAQQNLNNQYNQQLSANSDIAQYGQPGAAEQALQGQVGQSQLAVGQAQQQVQQYSGQAGGIINPGGQVMDLNNLTGQGRTKQFFASQNLISAQLQQQLAQTSLAYAQGNRQAAYTSAVQLYSNAEHNTQDMLNLYTQTAPKAINSNYDPFTGNITTTFQSPLTGQTSSAVTANAGKQQAYTNVGTPFLDPNTGQYTFPVTSPDGTITMVPATGAGSTPTNGSSQGQAIVNNSATGLTTPAAVNNNPGNLRNSDGSWQKFATPQEGFQVLMQDIATKQGLGQTASTTGLTGASTLSDFTSIYAPKSDGNDPVAYAQQIAQQMGVTPNTPIGQIPTASLATAVAQHEDGKYWNAITSGGGNTTALAPVVQKYVEQLPNASNSDYINSDRVSGYSADAVKNMAAGQVPVLTTDEVQSVKNISTIVDNLEQLRTLSSKVLGNGLGSFGSSVSNFIQSNIPQIKSTDLAAFQSYGDTAIKTIQGLAGGAGLRINQAAIDTAQSNMPTIYDNQAVAAAKINQVETFLQNSLTQLIPHATINSTAPMTNSGTVDYTSVLNQLAGQ